MGLNRRSAHVFANLWLVRPCAVKTGFWRYWRGEGKMLERGMEDVLAFGYNMSVDSPWGSCMRKIQWNKVWKTQPPADWLESCVSNMMGTKEGRLLPLEVHKRKPFLSFWGQKIEKWHTSTNRGLFKQTNKHKAFPGGKLSDGKRKLNPTLPGI